jgi:hypothetical protein
MIAGLLLGPVPIVAGPAGAALAAETPQGVVSYVGTPVQDAGGLAGYDLDVADPQEIQGGSVQAHN